MNLEQLEYVVAVAKAGSLTQAAQHCHITVTGISRSLTLFEQEIGIRVFTRSRSGAAVTPEGRRIVDKATDILLRIQELKTEAQHYHEMSEAKLTISTIPGPIAIFVDVLTELKKEFPKIGIEILESGTDAVLEDVKRGKSDVGFVLLNKGELQKHPELDFDPVMKGNLVLGVSAHSPLAQADAVTMQDLQGQPFVLYNDPHILEMIHQWSETVNVLMVSNNVEALVKAVQENIAITLATHYSVRANAAFQNGNIRMIPFKSAKPNPSFLWSITARSGTARHSKAAQLFVTRIRNELLR